MTHRASRFTIAATLVAAIGFATVVRPQAFIGLAVLALLFVPLERVFALRPQRVRRPGLGTDITHLLVNSTLVAIGAVVFAIAIALPLIWLRPLDLVGHLSAAGAVAVGFVVVFTANYWGHRLTHTVPFLWRFHAVHHSIEHMDWVASGRLHPLDSAFTQGFTVAPLIVLGYSRGSFISVTAFVTLLAVFQHANLRLRFPGLRWVLPTPEWHHWHHALDAEAVDKNFGLPVLDVLFGTAYLPKGRHALVFGTTTAVPAEGYLAQLAFPLRRSQHPPTVTAGV
jgi:sterol desaturase/sphingolipid hydroxylase (fatty acid hydroxylase superfamily)